MILSSSAEAYEKVSLKAVESWLSDMSIPLYVVGPLLPPNYGTDTALLGIEGDIEFKTFLMLYFRSTGSILFHLYGFLFSLKSMCKAHTYEDVTWLCFLAGSPRMRGRSYRDFS